MSDSPTILCVDDEPNVLDGLALHLRRRYEVLTATSGASGLDVLRERREIAVVVSDMRMPRMDGATFLAEARALAPDAVRMLLTGHADLDSAIAAVNAGQLFRFLTKPCPPPLLIAAVDAALAQHRLVTGERVLLEETLRGCIRTLTEVLSLTSPTAFGRATRLRQLVSELAVQVQLEERWQVEVAAMLSQLGAITLPLDTVEKVHFGHPLSDAEQKMLDRAPAVTEQLLGSIPRLELVREMLAAYPRPYRPEPPDAPAREALVARGAGLLRVAADYDALRTQGNGTSRALDTMRGRVGQYDPAAMGALVRLMGAREPAEEVRELPVSGLVVGMVLADDLRLANGVLLVSAGCEVTPGLLARLRNFSAQVKQQIRIIARRSEAPP